MWAALQVNAAQILAEPFLQVPSVTWHLLLMYWPVRAIRRSAAERYIVIEQFSGEGCSTQRPKAFEPGAFCFARETASLGQPLPIVPWQVLPSVISAARGSPR